MVSSQPEKRKLDVLLLLRLHFIDCFILSAAAVSYVTTNSATLIAAAASTAASILTARRLDLRLAAALHLNEIIAAAYFKTNEQVSANQCNSRAISNRDPRLSTADGTK